MTRPSQEKKNHMTQSRSRYRQTERGAGRERGTEEETRIRSPKKIKTIVSFSLSLQNFQKNTKMKKKKNKKKQKSRGKKRERAGKSKKERKTAKKRGRKKGKKREGGGKKNP